MHYNTCDAPLVSSKDLYVMRDEIQSGSLSYKKECRLEACALWYVSLRHIVKVLGIVPKVLDFVLKQGAIKFHSSP